MILKKLKIGNILRKLIIGLIVFVLRILKPSHPPPCALNI